MTASLGKFILWIQNHGKDNRKETLLKLKIEDNLPTTFVGREFNIAIKSEIYSLKSAILKKQTKQTLAV